MFQTVHYICDDYVIWKVTDILKYDNMVLSYIPSEIICIKEAEDGILVSYYYKQDCLPNKIEL